MGGVGGVGVWEVCVVWGLWGLVWLKLFTFLILDPIELAQNENTQQVTLQKGPFRFSRAINMWEITCRIGNGPILLMKI